MPVSVSIPGSSSSPSHPSTDQPISPPATSSPLRRHFSTSSSLPHLRKLYAQADQSHVFAFYDQLAPAEQRALLKQLSSIDVLRVNRIFKVAVEGEMKGKSSVPVGKIDHVSAGVATTEDGTPLSPSLAASQHLGVSDANIPLSTPPGYTTPREEEVSPLPKSAYTSLPTMSDDERVRYAQQGLEAVAAGRVAVLLMAGGQGTRLGSASPKGCYDVGLPSHKSLFQIQAERIRRLQRVAEERTGKRAGSVVIPWYIMTSEPTRKETEAFFEGKGYFGLDKKDVIFFDQGVLPALSNEGKLLMATKSSVAVAPDGNGGLYAAIRQPLSPSTPSTSVLTDMRARGIEHVHTYCVDNSLVRVADPLFLGYCIAQHANCGAKVVKKLHAHESVGVLGLKGEAYAVIEYSEITKEQAEAIDQETGEIAFRAANIVNHYYTTDFLDSIEAMESRMAFHIARKKIPTLDIVSGEPIKPAAPNGMKLELFVFDVFPFTKQLSVLEVGREDEFSPLKNAPGSKSDCPETSRRDVLAMHKRWLEAAGAEVPEGIEIELSPCLTYSGEGLEAFKGARFSKSGAVETANELKALV